MNGDRKIQEWPTAWLPDRLWPSAIVFIGLLALSWLAKGYAISNPLPSVDGWSWASSAGGRTNAIGLYLYHQRYGQVALYWLLDQFGYRTIAVATSSNAIALVLGAISAIVATHFVHKHPPIVAMLAAGAIFCLHPMTVEILTFSDVTLDVYIAITCTVIALYLAKNYTSWLGFASSVALLCFAVSVYQLALNIAAVLACINLAYAISTKEPLAPSIRPITAIAAALCAYLAILGLAAVALQHSHDPRGTLVGPGTLIGRVPELINALKLAFFPPRGWVSRATSLAFVAALGLSAAAVILAALRVSLWRAAAVAALLFCALLSIVGVAIAGQVLWLVPRVLIAAAAFGAGTILIGLLSSPKPVRAVILVLVCASTLGFVAASNKVFYDQRRLFLWDTSMANRIVGRLETLPNYRDMTTFVAINPRTSYGYALPTAIGDMNLPALFPQFSAAPMIEQSTGVKLSPPGETERKKAETFCLGAPKWPAPGSTGIVDNVGIACF